MTVRFMKLRFWVLFAVCFLLVVVVPIDIIFNPENSTIERINLPNAQINWFDNNYDWLKNGNLIAHALGGVDNKAYTNSLEAFTYNYGKGHRLFEVDLILTTDNILFARHDWNLTDDEIVDLSLPSTHYNGRAVTYEQAKALSNGYTPLTFDDICNIMKEYDDIYIITDTKGTDSGVIKMTFDYMVDAINKVDPKLLDRIVVQVYNQNMYTQLTKDYDFKSYIYTLYQSNDSPQQVLDFVEKSGVRVITMPVQRIVSYNDFITSLNNKDCYVFTHTVNDAQTFKGMRDIGIYGIYTDFISHDDLE